MGRKAILRPIIVLWPEEELRVFITYKLPAFSACYSETAFPKDS
jgi:hypothetical protein